MLRSSQFGPEMIGPAGMSFGAGPLYTNALMGQAPSTAEREHARKASSTILREDSIRVEESDNPSRPDSYSMHFDCTTQAPYSNSRDSNMMTQGSILKLPKDNASHDLAFFLRTTGPTATHRRPSKVEGPRRAVASPRAALRLLKLRHRRANQPVLRDEGGLLTDSGNRLTPSGVNQKFSSTGKKYLALQVPSVHENKGPIDDALTLSPSIMESTVSISFADSINSGFGEDGWVSNSYQEKPLRRPPTPLRRAPTQVLAEAQAVGGDIHQSPIPVRPPASDPPTPEPGSAVSMAESYQSDLTEHPATRTFDPNRALTSHPVHATTSSSLPLPEYPRLSDESPQNLPTRENEFQIEHPSPRRFASHTALLQRASSMGSSLYRRSVSDSPGPPPRSPLRLRRDPRTIENMMTSCGGGGATPKLAPSIRDVKEYNAAMQPIKPTVVTDCTGPIKRPTSRGKHTATEPAHSMSRRERGEQTRARKLRDRPIGSTQAPARAIDAVINAPLPPPRHRLKKARPHIHIPELRPAPLATRASSSASSNASWKKVTESTRTPVSAVPSEDTPTTSGTKTGYTPISPTTSNGSANVEAGMALSPVMLVAEEVPIPKAKPSPRPAKLIVRESKPYAPRPRSASISRGAMKRRSHQGAQTPSRPDSPNWVQQQDETPPLPSPPPNRALPPTPPASGSEQPKKGKSMEVVGHKKDLPMLPPYQTSQKESTLSRRVNRTPHVATQAQQKCASLKEATSVSRMHARLETLERRNALLSAALEAVIRTNGTLNGPLRSMAESESQSIPMSWETRIARRSAASHAASSSNGSALELYMRTRHGSKHAP